MWKFCGKAQFPHSFGRFTRNYVETVLFHKISTPGSQVKLRHFKQCYCEVFKSYSDLRLKLWFCKVVPFSKRVNQLIEYACYCSNDVLHNNIKKPSRFRSDNSRRKIYIYIFHSDKICLLHCHHHIKNCVRCFFVNYQLFRDALRGGGSINYLVQ